MTGKHDKKSDDDQSAKLLLTGPIAIRGLGRGVKDALVPGRPSRHRAFIGESAVRDPALEGVDSATGHSSVAEQPADDESGSSADAFTHVDTQIGSSGTAFPQHVDVARTKIADGPWDDRPTDRSDDAQSDGAATAESPSSDSPSDSEPFAARVAVTAGDSEFFADRGSSHYKEALIADGELHPNSDRAPAVESDLAIPEEPVLDADDSDLVLDDEQPVDADNLTFEPLDGGGEAIREQSDSTADHTLDLDDNELYLGAPVSEATARNREWITAEELFSGPSLIRHPHNEHDGPPQEEGLDDFAAATAGMSEPTATDANAATDSDAATSELVAAAAPETSTSPTRPLPSVGPSGRSVPIRERFGREAVGIAVLVVLALICGGLITAVVLKTQRDSAIAAQEAADYTPPPLATPEPTSTGPVVAVIGDGTTSAAASGATSAERWSTVLAKSLDGAVDADASGGMGYATKGNSGGTFVTAAAKIPSNADVVVFFGGAADANVSTLSLAKAATDAFSTASEQAPDAKVIVVGPAVADGVSIADLTTLRNTLRSSAGIAKATWIDPIDKDWLSTRKQAGKPTALTVADEKTLASKMETAITAALK